MLELEIEGSGAGVAAQELTELEGIEVQWEPVSDSGNKRDLMTVAAAIATIVGLVGGTLDIAERLLNWYQNLRQKGSAEQKIDKVILQVGQRRINLENTSVTELKTLLDTLNF